MVECCKILKDRLEPFKKELPENCSWPELVAKAFSHSVDLSAMYQIRYNSNTKLSGRFSLPLKYSIYFYDYCY